MSTKNRKHREKGKTYTLAEAEAIQKRRQFKARFAKMSRYEKALAARRANLRRQQRGK